MTFVAVGHEGILAAVVSFELEFLSFFFFFNLFLFPSFKGFKLTKLTNNNNNNTLKISFYFYFSLPILYRNILYFFCNTIMIAYI